MDPSLTDEEAILKRVKDAKSAFDTKYGEWQKEARENYDMVAGGGRQWDKDTRDKLEEQERVAVEFNRLGTIVDAVSGSEINNRQETTYIPRLPGAVMKQGIGNLRSAAAKWVRDNCDAEDEESDAFVDVLIAGVGATLTRMDYEEDEEGQILIERKDPLRLGWDARACKRNLSDRTCNWEDVKYTKEEILARWPEKAEGLTMSMDLEDDADELEVVNPANAYKDDGLKSDGSGLVDVCRFQWYDLVCIYKVADPSGALVEMDEERFAMAQELNPALKYAKVHRRVYMEAFIAGNTVLESGPLCDGASQPVKGFTYEFITGKRDRNKGYWYGLVRPGKDPQRWANKFFSQILHIINTNAKGGVMVETGAVPNQAKFEEDWAKADRVNWVNPGGLGKIQPKVPAQIPPALFQTMDFAIGSIRDCMGVNLELLGMVDRQQAGILEAQRTQAGLTILAPFFGSLRLYRKRHGRLLAYFIREYISDGRLIRVAGEESEQYIELLREPQDIDCDVVVDSAPTSRDTKEKTWAAIGPILGMMQQQGIQPPPEVLDYLPIPTSLAQKIKEAVIQAQKRPPDPKQEAMFAAELDNKEADTELKEAGAAEKYAKAQAPGYDMLAALFGPQPQAGQGAAGPAQPENAPQGGMQQVADSLMMGLNQLAQSIQVSQVQQQRSLEMIIAAVTAPRTKRAVYDDNGRIVGATDELRLQ